MNFPHNLLHKLHSRERENNLRSLAVYKPDLINLASNDYLAFSKLQLPELPLPHGSTGSRMISGNHPVFAMLENDLLPNFHRCEAALFYNSGYTANLGLISAIAQRGDCVIYDEYVHASIRDGIRLGFAQNYSFQHNNLDSLKQKLVLAKGTIYVVIESVYSMGGDLAPLKEIIELCREFGAFLIVDEAHALGVYDNGLCVDLKVENEVFARVFTYGKAMGGHGASVCGSALLKEYLLNFSRAFIYTTASPPSEIGRLIQLIHYYQSPAGAKQKQLLRSIINEYRAFADLFGFKSTETAIQFIETGSNDSAIALEQKLMQSGYFVKAIKSPTVEKGKEGLRITLHAGLPNGMWTRFFEILK